jgi:hypothetical protein
MVGVLAICARTVTIVDRRAFRVVSAARILRLHIGGEVDVGQLALRPFLNSQQTDQNTAQVVGRAVCVCQG